LNSRFHATFRPSADVPGRDRASGVPPSRRISS
jgi:hypothetical protein